MTPASTGAATVHHGMAPRKPLRDVGWTEFIRLYIPLHKFQTDQKSLPVEIENRRLRLRALSSSPFDLFGPVRQRHPYSSAFEQVAKFNTETLHPRPLLCSPRRLGTLRGPFALRTA